MRELSIASGLFFTFVYLRSFFFLFYSVFWPVTYAIFALSMYYHGCKQLQGRRNWVEGGTCAPHSQLFSATLMYPFSNHAYMSFPSLILFRLVNYWLLLIYDSLRSQVSGLIYDVSGLLKIKLTWSACFYRVCPKILAFRPLTSRLTSGLGACNQWLKTKFCVLSIVQKRSVLSQVKGKSFSSSNNHKIFTNAHFVWCLKSGFSNSFSPVTTPKHTGSKTQPFKVPFE